MGIHRRRKITVRGRFVAPAEPAGYVGCKIFMPLVFGCQLHRDRLTEAIRVNSSGKCLYVAEIVAVVSLLRLFINSRDSVRSASLRERPIHGASFLRVASQPMPTVSFPPTWI